MKDLSKALRRSRLVYENEHGPIEKLPAESKPIPGYKAQDFEAIREMHESGDQERIDAWEAGLLYRRKPELRWDD